MDSVDALMEEKKLLAEAKYRNYMTNIDKALRNFEYSSEWADLISALGKLSKAISSNTQYQVIPRRIKISKRLAQCMHPALPSGVHLKALETYAVIFSKTGPERLATELFIYSSGLFPLLGYAAMNVRPALLGIYETYFVPLGEKLRPALSGFLSGVLPGYESGLDHFERTNSLLVQVCVTVNPTHFYTVLWECIATNASIRLPAITYLLDHFNKRLGMQEQTFVMGHNRDIMMSGLCACLNDSMILVQRNALEFLLLGFPMHTIYLTKVDLIKLVTNGLNTILRRDMSLNRRLYSWLLGSEISKTSPTYDSASLDGVPETTQSYFEKHSKDIVIQSLICTLKFSLECTPFDLKPYRIMISLLDKTEIGSAVLDHVLCDIIRTMSLSSGNMELLKSANLLFATFDPAYIWSFMTSMYEKSCKKSQKHAAKSTDNALPEDYNEKFPCVVGSGEPSLMEICFLTEFLLETISLEMYNETTRLYLPKVFLAITQILTIHVETVTHGDITASLKLCMKIVSRVQPMITSPIKLSPHINPGSSDEKVPKCTTVHTPLFTHAGGTLEKSKSDSKLNQFSSNNSMQHDTRAQDALRATSSINESMGRSDFSQNMESKSAKKKKAKSYSKLTELDKEICPDTGDFIDPQQSSSDLDTPLTIKKFKSKAKSPYMRIRNSPLITRPKNINIEEPHSFDPTLLKTANNEPNDESKSTPSEDTPSGTFEPDNNIDLYTSVGSAEQFSILEKCIRQYEIFFEIYLAHELLQIKHHHTTLDATKGLSKIALEGGNSLNLKYIFESEDIYEDVNPNRFADIDKLFDTLRLNVVNRSQQLENLLNRSFFANGSEDYEVSPLTVNISKSASIQPDNQEDKETARNVKSLINLKVTTASRNSIKLAANLLVEMSTFPNYNKNIVLDETEKEIPSWLKVLCLVASYMQSDRELQLAIITTLFDLLSLLKSQIEHTTGPGVTFVVMLPLLKFSYVSYLENKTRVFQLVTSILWSYLGEPNIDPTQITGLLYQLHNCLESGLVELVIGNRMYAQNMHQQFAAAEALLDNDEPIQKQLVLREYCNDRAAEIQLLSVSPISQMEQTNIRQLKESESKSLRKFELLWHLGRDKHSSRGFEKTLLKVLDTLSLPYYMSVRTIVTKWMQSALLRGDLPRLMKPLYKILLSSDSKRIGIVHLQMIRSDESSAKLGKNDVNGEEKLGVEERDVYAISSEFGNIRYHMDVSSNKKKSPIRTFHKKIFGVALSSKNKTSNFVSEKTVPAITTETTEETTIGLIINPLDNSPDFDNDMEEIECISTELIVRKEKFSKSTELIKDQDRSEQAENDASGSHDYDQDYTDDSASSLFDSESETRETSLEKEDSSVCRSSAGGEDENFAGVDVATNMESDLKRYVGDCERVTELLSQHDRTKNRKTYHLTREKTPGGSSLTSNDENLTRPYSNNDEDGVHPAEEYFCNDKENKCEATVEVFVKDLIDQSTVDGPYSEGPLVESKKKKKPSLRKQKKSNKTTSPNDKKRISCISKTSTDSSNSRSGTAEPQQRTEQQKKIPHATRSGNEDERKAKEETPSVASTINVEDKRRKLSLETNKNKPEWDFTQEAIEKGKLNVQILRKNVAQAGGDSSTQSLLIGGKSEVKDKEFHKLKMEKLNLFHNHILVYSGLYDTKQTLYAFQTIRNIIASDKRTFICLSITTSLSSTSMKQLLIRHRKSISGKGFAGSITSSEFAQSYRGCMHLEVLVTICLYYARGYFHRESTDGASETPTQEDLVGNCRVQLESIELLTQICRELTEIVKGMGKGLACYIADLMARCKLQKVVLYCLNSSVALMEQKYERNTLVEQILKLNYPSDEKLYLESSQVELLRLLTAVIKLEYEVHVLKNDTTNPLSNFNSKEEVGNTSPIRLSNIVSGAYQSLKYIPNYLVSQQPMFLGAVLNALQNERLRHIHRNWTDLVTTSLNSFSCGSLTEIVISIVHQICDNIDRISKLTTKEQWNLPPDYVVSQLEALTILCHYSLLDNTQQTALSHLLNQAYPQTSVVSQSSNTSQLLNNIVHSFLSSATPLSAAQSESQSYRNQQMLTARNVVLLHLPRIVGSVAALWDSEIGQMRQVKQQLMEFLSPVSLHHGTNFLAAIAVAWQERGELLRRQSSELNRSTANIAEQYQCNSTPQVSPGQLCLVGLVSSIRVMPMDSLVQTLHQVVKSPPPVHHPSDNLNIEVSALELFYFYLKSAPAPQLADSWSSLLALLRDGLNLGPPAQFTLLVLVNEFVQRYPQMPFQDKKDIRDLHDITSRLVDSLSNIAGSCLEQTTWLRRNLAVKEDISAAGTEGSSTDNNASGQQQQYSVQAQSVLAATLANLLDVAYGSQEKDKVVTIITTLLYNITPYLKNHTTRNIPSFYACSSLLASLSGYQYTRKAWRKDMLDLLLDTAFFQMDISCLPFWKQIMDSLMTYDNTTFRELMSRVSLTQTGSLNIFTSREQEYEQRAMLLKRLAFVIFCSEFDQYHKYMPEIQEQLANSLRLLTMVPSVQAAVFLCFRVLLLRMSPDHVTSLWPIIIAEMVQVFLAMEQELKSDSEDPSQQMRLLSGAEIPWSTSSNGLSSQNNIVHWRSVQLEATKLLELGCILPATNLPHFQMYRWAFVGTNYDAYEEIIIPNGGEEQQNSNVSHLVAYVPHIRRIARLMDMKYTTHSPTTQGKRGQHVVLTAQQINSLQDLYGFFSTLSVTCPNPRNYADIDKEVSSCLAEVEDVLANDFLERMPGSITPR